MAGKDGRRHAQSPSLLLPPKDETARTNVRAGRKIN